MAREDRQRRRGEGRIATSQYRRLTHWRPWHHGDDESLEWLAAAGHLDTAALTEGLEDGHVGDALATVPPRAHDPRSTPDVGRKGP